MFSVVGIDGDAGAMLSWGGNASMEGSVMEFLRCLGCRDIESYGKEIGGQVGFVAFGINIFDRPKVFAIYWPDRVSRYPGTYSGTVRGTISSDLPEKVVESPLDTADSTVICEIEKLRGRHQVCPK